jgi:two-component system, response regulator
MINIKNPNLDSILLIEDEEDHARLIMKGLKSVMNLINDIVWIENGGEALDYLFKRGKYENQDISTPGLILLDLKLPIKDGFDVLTEIKKDEILRKIPVVMLTTSSNSEDVNIAMELGANDFIVKPVKFDDFILKISNLGYYWGFVSDSNSKY